jgi:hypothetical protein
MFAESASPPSVALIDLACAVVELNVAVATPAASVTAVGWPMVLFAPVALTTTSTFGTGFPLASRAVTVTVTGVPAAIEPLVTPIDDCVADTTPGATVTVGV